MWIWTMVMAQMLSGPTVAAPPASAWQPPASDTIVVKMVNKSATQFAFEPASVTVHPGDVLQFLQTGSVPHDVQLTKAPSGAKIGSLKIGPMLTSKGQTYDLAIDGRFPPGHYAYDCLPHFALGMKGSFDVVATASNPSTGR